MFAKLNCMKVLAKHLPNLWVIPRESAFLFVVLSVILSEDHGRDGGERRGRTLRVPARPHGATRGDTQLYWTRQDQLETRAWFAPNPDDLISLPPSLF
jgi:uncharacterized membrane-anchored protein